MKRVANDVAVQTLLYTVSPQQLVRIVDYPSFYAYSYRKNGVIVFDDNNCGMSKTSLDDYKVYRASRSKILGTKIEINMHGNPILIISVCTEEEQY